MSTTSNDEHWLKLITQCRSSGLTDRQWCIENWIPVSTFYYHIQVLRKKACEIPDTVDATAQKQEVVQIPLWETEQHTSDTVALHMPSICLEMQGIYIQIHEQAGADVMGNCIYNLHRIIKIVTINTYNISVWLIRPAIIWFSIKEIN